MKENHITADKWEPYFYLASPIFTCISECAKTFDDYTHWPGLTDFNQLLIDRYEGLTSASGSLLQFVEQSGKPACLEAEYEVRIFISGEIQTRLENWHDYFQVLVWNTFPKTKVSINKHHATSICNRHINNKLDRRSSSENALTLFDECGAIIVCSDHSLIDLIKGHAWKKLFVDHKNEFGRSLKCFVFGHAMFEKALKPYIGMTVHAIILSVDTDFFNYDESRQINLIDDLAMHHFNNAKTIDTNMLQPFPLLGIPGWYKGNEAHSFYDNKQYFRDKRER